MPVSGWEPAGHGGGGGWPGLKVSVLEALNDPLVSFIEGVFWGVLQGEPFSFLFVTRGLQPHVGMGWGGHEYFRVFERLFHPLGASSIHSHKNTLSTLTSCLGATSTLWAWVEIGFPRR